MSTVWEGRRPVAVLDRDFELTEQIAAGVNEIRRGLVHTTLALAEFVKELGAAFAKVGGDDNRGRLHGAKVEVVAGRRNDSAHKIAVSVHTSHNGLHDDRKDLGVARLGSDLTGVEQVDAVFGADRPDDDDDPFIVLRETKFSICYIPVWARCVFYYCRTYYKAVRVWGGGEWRTCAMGDDEPRPVWMSLLITH